MQGIRLWEAAAGAAFLLLAPRAAFDGLPEAARFVSGAYEFAITYAGGDGNDVVLTAVPEPAAGGIAGGALAAWLLRRARRRLPAA